MRAMPKHTRRACLFVKVAYLLVFYLTQTYPLLFLLAVAAAPRDEGEQRLQTKAIICSSAEPQPTRQDGQVQMHKSGEREKNKTKQVTRHCSHLYLSIYKAHWTVDERERERERALAMAGADDLKVLGLWTSPFVIRVRIVLNLKGLAYEYVEDDLSNKSALLLSSNPVHKTVPVLLHAGRPVNESQIILQYIDEVWAGTGPAVLPRDPYERAAARFWAAYIDDKVKSAWLGMLFECRDEGERAEAVARAGEALGTLEGALRGKPFFGGDGVGFVDAVLGGYLGWFGAVGRIIGRRLIDPAKTPLLAAWEDRFRAADVAKGVVPDDVDKMLAFLETLLANYYSK
jgi:glutathione S-transferase